ncbi:trehalose-phosphatase [Salinicola sp. V024]|uniref:trehalose-phosphatase n=1 Tax=Salinicola sp. V024 TaxID=3459609 RepID=UPI0040451A26
MKPTDDELPSGGLVAFDAGVFDLDGVVTQTARVHSAAWKTLFDDYLRRRAARHDVPFVPFVPFDADRDYRRYVDGKPRADGVRSFLASRAISLPEGSSQDMPQVETIQGLGQRKDQLFLMQLECHGVDVYDSTVRFIHLLRAAGLKTALVSSSRNARRVLEKAGLLELFDVCMDGVEAHRLQLRGKPDPAIFRHAAAMLDVRPARALAVEDALSGVESARAAGYGLVIGLDHDQQRDDLLAHGADLVVNALTELDPADAPWRPDALAGFPAIARQLTQRRPAIFLDYDGTLTPIVARPELALLDDAMRGVLRRLARHWTVGIISGRDRAGVARLVGLETLIYAGSHGLDIAGPGGLRMEYPAALEYLPALDQAELQLRHRLETVEGALVERKRFAIAVHYRLVAPDQHSTVRDQVAAVAEAAAPRLRQTGGKRVFELRPDVSWDKGRALLWLLEALDLSGSDVLPFYLGDDETDEDAFTALQGIEGVGVRVAAVAGPTAARYRLDDVAAVTHFLERLEQDRRASA